MSELYKALAAAQSEIEGANKNSTNPHFRSKYADLGAVWDACRGSLTKHGLSVLQMPRSFEGELRLVTRIAHASGDYIEDEGFPLILGKQDMQGLGSATTYARRYGLMAMVGIAPEDDDGNAAVGDKGGQGKKVPAKAKLNEAQQKAATFADGITRLINSSKTDADLTALLAKNDGHMKALEKYPEINNQVSETIRRKYMELEQAA